MFFTYDLLEDKQVADINNSNILLYYCIKQLNSILIWVCAVTVNNRSQRMSRCGWSISDTLSCASCVTFLFLPHFDIICDPLLNRPTATWNLFVDLIFFLLITFLIYNRWIHIVCGRFVLVSCVSEC